MSRWRSRQQLPGTARPSLQGRARWCLARAGAPAVETRVSCFERLSGPQPGPAGGRDGVKPACQSPPGRSRARFPENLDCLCWPAPGGEAQPRLQSLLALPWGSLGTHQLENKKGLSDLGGRQLCPPLWRAGGQAGSWTSFQWVGGQALKGIGGRAEGRGSP